MKIKSIVLSIFFIGDLLTASAQDIVDGVTYWDQDYENISYCFNWNNVAGQLFWGQNINDDIHIENHILVFTTPSTVVPDGCPSWIGFTGVDPPTHMFCDFYRSFGGIDMTNGPYMTIRAKSNVDGAKLAVYLGSLENSDIAWFPNSSTRHTGSGTIMVELTLTTTFQTYAIDFSGIDPAVWTAWADKDNVNAYGVTGQEPDAKYFISRVEVGSVPSRTSGIAGNMTTRSSSVTSTDPCEIVDGLQYSSDLSLEVYTETGGHVKIDPSFLTDKVIVSDMFGRTEEFSSNDFHTQLKGMLVLSCVSGNKVKKVKVVMN